MRKTVLLLVLLISNLAHTQITTTPSIPTDNVEITITFDATGTELEDYTGDVYAHTGVITTESTNDTDWKYVIAEWTENTDKAKLTKISANTYEFKIAPDIPTFYNITGGDTVNKLAFVFRSSDLSKQTRPDIFIKVYDEGLNITFVNPLEGAAFDYNETTTIEVEASIDADMELFVNNTSIKQLNNTASISDTYRFTTYGYQTLKATASANEENQQIEITVYVKSETQNKTQPPGLKYGLNKNPDNSVTFLIQAPNKEDIQIIGDFTNWELNPDFQMYKDGDDFWLNVSGLDLTTEYAYQYYIDYDLKVADPYSEKILDPWNDKYIPESTYPNLKSYPTDLTTGIVSTFQIQEDEYTWNVTDFQKPEQENLIVYELLLRDFTVVGTDDIGDLKSALDHIDYLESLGINAIELMPVSEFEGNDSWGYNPSFHMALDKAYGTKNEFKKFVDECHKRGIAVILDVVYNHAFGQSPLAQMYWDASSGTPTNENPWLNVTPKHPYNVGNDFNHESDYTKTYVKQTIEHWVHEFKIDGFRFDLSKGFTQVNTYPDDVSGWSQKDPSRIEILKDYGNYIWNNTSEDVYLILEHFADNSEESELSDFGFMLWGNLNHSYNQNTMGYSTESDIEWISYQKRGWNNPNVMGYMESHDEERLMYKNLEFGTSKGSYNVKNLTTALSRQETAGLFFFTIPGPKMIWQFGELGYDYSINTCTDGTVNSDCRLSRKPIRWDYENNPNRKHIYNTWATLIEFKKQQPVFSSTDFTLDARNTFTKSIVLRDNSMDVVIVGNFDTESNTATVEFPNTGTWFEYFTGEQKDITNTTLTLELNPGEYKMYSSVKLLDPRGGTENDDSDGDGIVDTEDLCPNTMEGIEVNEYGCALFSLPSNNFNIETIGETCPNKNNGKLIIETEEDYNYSTIIDGTTYNFTKTLEVENLSPGTYDFCISVNGQTYEQCFEIIIEAGTSISAKAIVKSKTASISINKGTAPFNISINGKNVLSTTSSSFDIDVNHGDVVEVTSHVSCEGIFTEKIDLFEMFNAYPNPTNGFIQIAIPTLEKEVVVEIYNLQSQLLFSKKYSLKSGKISLNLQELVNGLYIAKILVENPVAIKIIKQ